MTRLRGSALSREATSSRQALSTLLRRARLRGKPPEVQVTASGFCSFCSTRIVQVDCAVPPRPSEAVTVTVTGVPEATPELSKLASEPLPVTRPALAVQEYVRASPSGSEPVARQRTVSPGRIWDFSTSQAT